MCQEQLLAPGRFQTIKIQRCSSEKKDTAVTDEPEQ